MRTENNTQKNVQLEQSYQSCRSIVKKSGSNFYYGMWLTLNKRKRDALFSIYAWMRAIDDIADSSLPDAEKIKQLEEFYQMTVSLMKQPAMTTSDDLSFASSFWPAFQQTTHEYAIDPEYFEQMYLGQVQSIQQNTYDNFADLYQYCYRVAATVGLVCVVIWGYTGGEQTLKMAEYRGIALQLINVVRDIQSDALSHKFFIPKEWLGHDEQLIQKFIDSKNKTLLIPVMQKIIDRAEYYYAASQELEHRVSRVGSLSLRVMSQTYFSLLKKIKKDPSLVLSGEKVKLNHFEKISVCMLGVVQWCINA